MFFSTTSKPVSKTSQVLPSNYHLEQKTYVGHVQIGGDNYYTKYFDTKEETELELLCLEKSLSYELIKTVQDEGVYPERAIIMEQKYQESGRTNSLYTGLNLKDDAVSVNNPE